MSAACSESPNHGMLVVGNPASAMSPLLAAVSVWSAPAIPPNPTTTASTTKRPHQALAQLDV